MRVNFYYMYLPLVCRGISGNFLGLLGILNPLEFWHLLLLGNVLWTSLSGDLSTSCKKTRGKRFNTVMVSLVGLWCLMPLPIIFQRYRHGQFYCWRNPLKTTDLPQVTAKLYYISSTPLLSRIRTHNLSGDKQWLHR